MQSLKKIYFFELYSSVDRGLVFKRNIALQACTDRNKTVLEQFIWRSPPCRPYNSHKHGHYNLCHGLHVEAFAKGKPFAIHKNPVVYPTNIRFVRKLSQNSFE